ncbi:thioredoxin family protein [Aeoliella sp. ICT_H6.2]|uniref:Thioredoxin family protein n=1 Tax=Aeoliella straminimaris TaxID=2954799 RepID=A0A9X2FAE5_9BACT|nr:thioredoxin family protein [Aeoliella straminimaris]MCO6044904.1 thioredoxin family protein [Aeoliella straminimaris]
MSIRRLGCLLVASVALLVTSVASGQGFDIDSFDPGGIDLGGFGADPLGGDPVQVNTQFTPATDERPAVLMITANIDPGFHIYSLTQQTPGPLPTTISLDQSDDYKPIGNWRSIPEPKKHVDEVVWPGQTIEEYEDEVTWYLPIEISKGVDVEKLQIAGTIEMQACDTGCQQVTVDFKAKRGEGVPIGPLDTSKSANVVTQSNAARGGRAPAVPQPPAEAGVFRADESVVTWYGWLEPNTVQPGARTYLYLRAEMPESWHINTYAKEVGDGPNRPTLVAPVSTDGLVAYQPQAIGEVTEKESPLPEFGSLRYHENEVVWRVPVDVSSDLKPGSYELKGLIGYQGCESTEDGQGTCEVSRAAEFNVKVNVGDSANVTSAAVNFTPAEYKSAAEQAKAIAGTLQIAPGPEQPTIIEFSGNSVKSDTSWFFIIGAALLGGFILNFMPCVLPVIGLKIMSFARQGGESRGRVFALNLAYVAGLLFVFMLLATLAAFYGYQWGELYTEPVFKISMTAFVFIMALSFLGVWEIPLPGFTGSGTAAQLASREGLGGAFFKGILTTILATPCSGPFLGPVFGFTITQPASMTFLIFLFIGLGMASPYLVIGAFPSLIRWMPKPGPWMDTLKQFLAFLLLGTVVYLLSTLHVDHYIPTMALLVALWFACWLGGRQPFTASASRKWGAWLSGFAVATLVGYFGFVFEVENELPWKNYTPAQLAQSRASGNVVMVEFTANWCPTCKLNLLTALDVPAVKSVVSANDVHAIKADWTNKDQEIEDVLLQLQSRTIPLLAIYPADRPDEVIVLRDTVSETQVLQALAAAGARASNPHHSFVLSRPPAEEEQLSDSGTLATMR